MQQQDAHWQLALSLHRYLLRAAHTLVSAFLWIIVFAYFVSFTHDSVRSLVQTAFLYALVQTITLLTAPLALKIMHGNMLRGVIYGTVIAVAAFIYIGALVSGEFPAGAAMVGILLGLHRALYRTPYALEHYFFVEEGKPSLIGEAMLALLPFAAALALSGGESVALVLYTAAILASVSLMPLFFAPNVGEHFSWGYRETFAHLIASRNKTLVLRAFLSGAGSSSLFLLWPLALVLVFHPAIRWYGALFSATLLVILLVRSSHGRTGHEPHADNATYLDEYTVLKEMALAGGRLIVGLGLGIIAALFLS